jgi:hypothetical protein
MTTLDPVSITDTVFASKFVTKAVCAAESTAMPYGPARPRYFRPRPGYAY